MMLCGFSCGGLDHGGMTYVESVYQVMVMVMVYVITLIWFVDIW